MVMNLVFIFLISLTSVLSFALDDAPTVYFPKVSLHGSQFIFSLQSDDVVVRNRNGIVASSYPLRMYSLPFTKGTRNFFNNSQLACFDFLHEYKERLVALDSQFLKYFSPQYRPMNCFTEESMSCDAYYSRYIYLGQGNERCNAPVLNKSVVFHEATHLLLSRIYPYLLFSSIEEALADIFQAVLLDSPVFAPEFFKSRIHGEIRSLNTFLQFPHDYRGEYSGSLILSGAWWRIYEKMKIIKGKHFAQKMMINTIVNLLTLSSTRFTLESFALEFVQQMRVDFSQELSLALMAEDEFVKSGLIQKEYNFKISNSGQLTAPRELGKILWQVNGKKISSHKIDFSHEKCFQSYSYDVKLFSEDHVLLWQDKIERFGKHAQEDLVVVSKSLRQAENLVPFSLANYSTWNRFIEKSATFTLKRELKIHGPFYYANDLEFSWRSKSHSQPQKLFKGIDEVKIPNISIPNDSGYFIIDQYGLYIDSLFDDIELIEYQLNPQICSF
jgi:hypothetical protein